MTDLLNPDTLNALWTCLVIAIAASSISYTITQTELFTPVRSWTQKLGHMIGYLFTCFYCMSHWVVLAGIAAYQPVLIDSGHLLVDLIVSTFFTITLTVFFCGFIYKVFLTAIAMKMKEKEIKEMMAKK